MHVSLILIIIFIVNEKFHTLKTLINVPQFQCTEVFELLVAAAAALLPGMAFNKHTPPMDDL